VNAPLSLFELPPSAPPVVTLRPYQERGIDGVRALLGAGRKSVLLVCPTGGGKTVIFSAIASGAVRKGKRVLVLAHRKELIDQGYTKLLASGIDEAHLGTILAGDPRRRPHASVQVASVQTLTGRAKPPADLIIVDECFPAGTLVDGRPIESIAVGETVRAFDHATGCVAERAVTHVFRSVPKGALVTIRLGDGTRLTCTAEHPTYTRGGYAPAASLVPGTEVLRVEDDPEDLRGVRHGLRPALLERHDDARLLAALQGEATRVSPPRGGDLVPTLLGDGGAQGGHAPAGRDGAGLLLAGMQPSELGRGVLAHDGGNQPALRERADDDAQPDAPRGGPGPVVGDTATDRVEATGAVRQGPADARSAAGAGGGAGLGDGGSRADGAPEGAGQPRSLHAGHGGPERDGCGGGGRLQPHGARGAGEGRAQGCVPAWTRVDGVEVHERGGDGGPGPLCPDGHVYNLEVEGHHNYFAAGVLVHNCHHAMAASYRKIFEAYPHATLLGVTATPCRADGRGLGDVFAELVHVATFRDLATDGFLVAPRVFTSRNPLDLSKLKTTGGDYNLADLDKAVNTRELVGDIVATWQARAEGRTTVVFASSVEHSRAIVAQFIEAGVTAEHLDGTTDKDERAAILARLASGETTVVSNMGVLTEGWDLPRCKCVVLARPTKSLGLYLQMAGRGLRPWQDVSALLLDHAGCVLAHGFPQDDREWPLEGKKKKAAAPAVRTCPGCYAALPGGTAVCTECGFVFPPAERGGIEQVDGELLEVVPPSETPLEERRAWYAGVLENAARRGRKVGFARHRYREKFGGWPAFRVEERTYYPAPTVFHELAAAVEAEAQPSTPAPQESRAFVAEAAPQPSTPRARRIDLTALLASVPSGQFTTAALADFTAATAPEVDSWSL
jgi:superfamily II DNA or RNA helicase